MVSNGSETAFTGQAANVPGRVVVDLLVWQQGDPTYETPWPSGFVPRGCSLAEFRKRLGGNEGYVIDHVYRGENHFVSLKAWDGADPDKTRVMLGFKFIPDKPIAAEHRHLFPPDQKR